MKLYWQHGTSVLPSCVCYLAHLGPHLYSQSGCVRLTALGQPSAGSGTCSYLTFDIDPYSLAEDGFCFVTVPAQTLTNVELSFQNVFGRRLDHYPLPPSSCYLCPSPRVQVCCVGDARLFWLLIWHFMANAIVFEFDASGKFAWCGHLVKRTITPVEVVIARCQTCSSTAAQHLQPCRCIASSAMNRLGHRRKLFYTHDAS